MSTRRTPTVALLGAALATILFAGCNNVAGDGTGVGAGPSDSPTPSPSGVVMSPTPILPPVTPSKNPPGTGPTTLTGTVEMSEVEGGCIILRVGTTTYQLMGGDNQILRPGNRVTVEGRVNTDVSTICQVGPVFEVASARPA